MFDDFDDNDSAGDDLFSHIDIEQALLKYRQLSEDQSVFFSEDEIETLSYHFFVNSQLDDQLAIVEQGLYLYPNKVDFMVEKASIYSMKNQNREALEIIHEAKEIEPYNPLVHKMEAEILMDLDRIDEAETSFNSALENSEFEDDEFIIETYIHYAQLISQNGKLDKANRLIEKALKRYPNQDLLFNQLTLNFISNNAYPEGIEYFKKRIDNDPYSYLSWYHLGRLYELTNKQELALSAYEYSSLASNDSKNALFNMGGILESKGEYTKAIDNYLACVKGTGDLYPFICIARSYLALEDGPMARYYLEKAKNLEEMLPEYNYLIGYSYLSDNQALKALPFFKKVFNEDHEDFAALKGIFTCYSELEDFESFETLFKDQYKNNYDLLLSNWKEMAATLYQNEMDVLLEEFLIEIKTIKKMANELDGVMICIRYDQQPSESNKDVIISRLINQFEDTLESVKLFCTDLYDNEDFKRTLDIYHTDNEQ